MAEEAQKPAKPSLRRSLLRAVVAVGFSAILMIPKLRRLRRNARAWTAIRVIAIIAGGWLLWHGGRSHAVAIYAAPAIALILFGALVRARPVRKSVDEVSREVEALVVLNGGVLIDAMHLRKPPRVSIYVTPSRLLALSAADYQRFEEIPIASISGITARPATPATPSKAKPPQPAWDLDITWDSGEISTRFRYEGSFAEHLARVAERTLHQVWKKQLPVIDA